MSTMTAEELSILFADPVAQRLLAASLPARLAYAGLDGAPRVVPIGWGWDGSHLRMWTNANAHKVPALRRDPRVAVTIDTESFPPKVLLVRGSAELEEEAGVPQGYVEMGHKMVDDEHFADWEAGVRNLYDTMVTIRITPTWAKILDFETRLPSGVAELIRQKQAYG